MLETRFGTGLQFLSTWRAWQLDPLRPQLLHYVSVTQSPPCVADLLECATPYPELTPLAQALSTQWVGLLPGFHRFMLDGGRVMLTLCVGELMGTLRDQRFVADTIYLDADPATFSHWTAKALARCSRRGTRLLATSRTNRLQTELTQCGFEAHTPADRVAEEGLHWQFNPRWTLKNTRDRTQTPAASSGSCAVIGAGLAGASVAAALARRGWQVCVLDQGDTPAAGASGLPVGLVVPHVSFDDCALSRLSRSGVRLMLQQARHLLQEGLDWGATGTLECRVDGSPGLPSNWPAEGQAWSQVAAPSRRTAQNLAPDIPAVWHHQAAWLKPAQLVKAWLAQPGVTFQGRAQVAALRQAGGQWEVLDAQDGVLAIADRVVFANADGAMPLLNGLVKRDPALDLLLDRLPVMHGVHGLLSWGLHTETPGAPFPPFPVNGSGSVIPAVPMGEQSGSPLAWYVGSSYQPTRQPEWPNDKNHAANLARVRLLNPDLATALEKPFSDGTVQTWKSVRCVTSDRLPLVGPLNMAEHPSLWICAGMGSRGMSFSVLCAEFLAAQWGAEPLPIDAGLAHMLVALRGRAKSGKID